MALSVKFRQILGHGLIYLIVIAGAVLMIFPFLWTVSTSLKTIDQLVALRIQLIPDPIAWDNYAELFRIVPVLLQFRNTMKIVLAAEFGALVVCSMVGYAFAHVRFAGRDTLFFLLLSTMMLPKVSTLIPYFVMFDRLGWVNTFWPLIVPRLLAHDAFYIFLMRQFFMGIPQDLGDAARIDGCGDIAIWLRIVMPNSQPVLATVGIFAFQRAWTDFMHPLIYLGPRRANWTLALGLAGLKGAEAGAPPRTHLVMAFSVLMILPMIGIFAFGQKYLIRGVTFSGLKG